MDGSDVRSVIVLVGVAEAPIEAGGRGVRGLGVGQGREGEDGGAGGRDGQDFAVVAGDGTVQLPPEVLGSYPPGTLFDCYPLMIMSTSAFRSLQEALPESVVDQRRFRPSLVIDTGDADGHPEFEWAGRRMRLGGAEIGLGGAGFGDQPLGLLLGDGFLGQQALAAEIARLRREDDA